MKRIHRRSFRLAAIIQLLVAVGHVAGHFSMPRPANETERNLIIMMSSYEKEIAGGKMSILNSYDGLNISYGLFFLLVGIVNLTIEKRDHALIKPISLINAMAMGAGAILSLIFFFWIPVVYFGLTSMVFFVSFASCNEGN